MEVIVGPSFAHRLSLSSPKSAVQTNTSEISSGIERKFFSVVQFLLSNTINFFLNLRNGKMKESLYAIVRFGVKLVLHFW